MFRLKLTVNLYLSSSRSCACAACTLLILGYLLPSRTCITELFEIITAMVDIELFDVTAKGSLINFVIKLPILEFNTNFISM